MKLGRILKSIDIRRPNSFEEDCKIEFINSVIRQWGHIIGKVQRYEFITEGGKEVYPLPDGAEGDSIKAVYIGGVRAEAEKYESEVLSGRWQIEGEGYMRLCEEGGKRVEVFYCDCKEFEGFKEGYLESDCGVRDSYADILVYGALYQMAECEEDINAAANFKERMDELLRRAMQGRYLKDGKYPTVREVRGR
jgi:hypothetical protein